MLPILSLFVLVLRRHRARIHCHLWPGVALGLFYALLITLLYMAFERIPVAVAITIVFTYPLLLGLIALLLGRQSIGLAFVLLLLLAFVGVVLVVGPDLRDLNRGGLLMAVGAALAVTLYIQLSEHYLSAAERDGELLALYMVATATVVYSVGALILDLPLSELPIDGWWILLIAGVTGSIGQITLFEAVRKLPAAHVGIYMNFEIVVAIALAAWLLGQTMRWMQYLGVAMVLLAILAASLQRSTDHLDA